jgi:hypothetical protein
MPTPEISLKQTGFKKKFSNFLSVKEGGMKCVLKLFTSLVLLACIAPVVIGQKSSNADCNALFPIKGENGKMGYINHKGEIVIKPQFVSALDFNEGVGVVWISDEETGYVNLAGKLVALPGVEIISGKFSDGLAAAVVNNKVGYVNKSGKMIFQIPDKSTNYVYSFSEGLVPVFKKDEEFYFYNTKGEIAINRGFASPTDNNAFVGGMATVSVEEGWVVIDREGKFIAPPRKDGYSAPSEGLVSFSENGSTVYIDKHGKIALKVPYRRAGNFSEGLAWFIHKDKWGFIDKSGKAVIGPQFDGATEFAEGLAAVEINHKIGFIDRGGEFVIPPQIDFVFESFRCGLAKVKKTGEQRGYIDRRGNWVWKNPSDH